MEIWKDIPSYEGHYQVSNLGNVKSIKYSRQRILKPATNIHGYFMVCLHVKNTQKLITIHSLVSMAFLNHKPNKTHEIVIDHINNLKTDNRLENLQLITNRLNCSKDKKGYSSKFAGVCWDKQYNKWRAKIRIKTKQKFLGLFRCELKAAMAYQKALQTINN
jgi:NUMOD4 motif./AP2 domain./HNH endonuclease.